MTGSEEERAAGLRSLMVERQIHRRGISDPGILRAFEKVPRHLFTSPDMTLELSYGDHPLSIGFGQTISQPYIVAYMIDLLKLPGERGCDILEIGTGSGYEAAVLAAMGHRVVSLEVIPELSVRAATAIARLELGGSVALIAADGYNGWVRAAPYDGILVSAAPSDLPVELAAQLRDGRRMVVPVGSWHQEILVLTRAGGNVEIRRDLPVRFVPMVHRGRSSRRSDSGT